MADNASELTDANFSEMTDKGVALVDFWAERCPPCRAQGPVVEKIAQAFAGRATVGKLDVDSNPGVPTAFGLMYIPTLVLLRDGKEQKRFTGFTEEGTLSSAIEEALNGD